MDGSPSRGTSSNTDSIRSLQTPDSTSSHGNRHSARLKRRPRLLIITNFKGETIPIRLFLGGFDLTPTFREVNKKYSTRYYLSLVLIDEGTSSFSLSFSLYHHIHNLQLQHLDPPSNRSECFPIYPLLPPLPFHLRSGHPALPSPFPYPPPTETNMPPLLPAVRSRFMHDPTLQLKRRLKHPG